MDEEQKARMDKMEKSQAELNSKLNALIELMSKGKMKIEDEESSMRIKGEYEKTQDEGKDEDSVPNLDDPKEIEKLMGARKINMLEERLRAIEGIDFYGAIDAERLCLVLGVVIPPKFKTPEFEKYDGTKCPVAHLTMYCRKLAAHTKDDKLLMHVFQDSLTGYAARWYVKLDKDRVSTWNELARAFISQYKHVVDMAPDRLSLQNMEKKPNEGFKEYAQRWRDVASQVQPPLTDKETTMLFVNTLKAPYYDRLVGNATKNFADMVLSGEIIESAIKSGKIDGGDVPKKSNFSRNKEGEVQAVVHGNNAYSSSFLNQTPRPYSSAVSIQTNPTPQNQNFPHSTQAIQNPRPNREKSIIDPIPMSYKELYPILLNNHLIAPVYLEPMKPPYPKWFDANACCEYHFGNPGHSLENCTAFKIKVQNLVKAGMINFEEGKEDFLSGKERTNGRTPGDPSHLA